jgi:hypothetical protein
MPIELTCPCGRRLGVGEEHAGEQGRCPACGGLLRIPPRDAAASASGDPGLEGVFGPGFVESITTSPAEPTAEKKGGAEEKLTAAGCLLALVSTATIFIAAFYIVRWRDPATGLPVPRTVAIISPVLIGAAVNGVGMLLLRVIGVRVWVKKENGAEK